MLDNLSWNYRLSEPETALLLARTGLKLASDQNNQEFYGKFHSRKASAFFQLTQLDSAVISIKKSIAIAKEREDIMSLAGLYYNLSQYLNYQGNYPNALEAVYKANGLYMKLNEDKYLSLSYQRLGEIQTSTEHIPEAIEAFSRALKISKGLKDTLLIIPQLQSIGTLKVAEAQKQGESLKEGIQLLNEAKAYAELYPKALKFLPAINSNLGLAHARLGDCKAAIPYFEEGLLDIWQSSQTGSSQKAAILENYGHCLVQMEEYESAKYLALISLEVAEESQNPRTKLGVYNFLLELNEKLGDYEEAFKYQKIAADLAESLRNEAREKEINAIKKDFQIRQGELKVLEAEAQKRKAEYGIYALLASLLALALASYLTIQFLRKRQKEREIALIRDSEIEKEVLLDQLRKKELQSLSAALEGQEIERRRIAAELHDGLGGTMAALKMTFSSISRKINKQEPHFKSYSNAMKLLDNAVKEVRQLSHQMAAKQLLHEDLEAAIKELCELLRQNDTLKIKLDVAGLQNADLKQEQKLHIYRLIQEHFQNTLKHAGASMVELSINLRHNWLSIEYKDNGKGFSHVEGAVLPGLGLQNIEKRIQQMDGRWSLQTSKGKGIRSFIEIPLHQEYKGI
ncbi:MAG: histidine kinase [Bacteroidia bacterium]|nr:histidine kinase [Bacteroidia bacterium]